LISASLRDTRGTQPSSVNHAVVAAYFVGDLTHDFPPLPVLAVEIPLHVRVIAM
jgi:hypothetical protein